MKKSRSLKKVAHSNCFLRFCYRLSILLCFVLPKELFKECLRFCLSQINGTGEGVPCI